MEALIFEHAVAREALRLAYEQHKEFATTLKGVQQQRTVGDTFSQEASGQTIVDNMRLDLLVASGGVLSHAPRMHQTALLLIDSFQPEGFTTLAYEVIWTRILVGYSMDKTTYFYSTIIIGFIFGLSLGSFLIAKRIDRIKRLLSYLPSNNMEDPPIVDTHDDPRRKDASLNSVIPDNPNKSYDMKDVIRGIVDDGEFSSPISISRATWWCVLRV